MNLTKAKSIIKYQVSAQMKARNQHFAQFQMKKRIHQLPKISEACHLELETTQK